MPLKHSNPTRPLIDRKGKSYSAFAPYNFVPLPEKMIAGLPPLSHDEYHEKALTGWIDCELETCSPTYVRGMLKRELYDRIGEKSADKLGPEEKNHFAPFFSVNGRLIDNRPEPIIAGTTLRGMIRALVEIITAARMRWVNASPTVTFRAVAAAKDDPLREPYRDALGAFGSKVRAGYLERDRDGWDIKPARTPESMNWPRDGAFLKIKERQIGGKDIPGYVRFNSSNYRPNFFEVSFDVEQRRGKRGTFISIRRIGGRERGYTHKGVMVCSGNMLETAESGQTSPRKNHMVVLLPVDDKAARLEIPAQVIQDYRESLTPFQKEKLWGGEESGCLKAGAPVFYVAEGNRVLWFGHCPNFRVPARLYGDSRAATPRDFVPEVLRNDPAVDFAEAIFGWVEGEDKVPPGARAGRVFFGDAHYFGSKNGVWLVADPMTPHTLSSPKPTTFQHYLVQDRDTKHNPDDKASLAHYGTSPAETQIRGHKMYWHKGVDPDLAATTAELGHEKQLTRMIPLKPGVRFRFRIHFENLREVELGALLWALQLPGESGKTYRHKLGMGKPLGMGAVAITPRLFLSDRLARYKKLFNGNAWEQAANPAEIEPHITAFEKYMLNELGLGLEKKRLVEVDRIRMLFAMLSWPGPHPSLTRYLQIEHPEHENEYKERPVLPGPLAVEEASQALEPSPVPTELPREAPQEALQDYQKGVVKMFGLGSMQDFGFIQPKDGDPLVFVHQYHLAGGAKTLKADDSVQFKVEKGLFGPQAFDVRVLKGGQA